MKIDSTDAFMMFTDSVDRSYKAFKESFGDELDERTEELLHIYMAGAGLAYGGQMAEPRGFKAAKGFDKDKVKLPERSTVKSAGYDFFAYSDKTIMPGKKVLLDTGVKAWMLPSEVLLIFPRSSMAIKRNLILANIVPVIDADYYGNPDNDGHILICLQNLGDEPQEIKAGDKIAQGIFLSYKTCGDVPEVERTGGIGSTGK